MPAHHLNGAANGHSHGPGRILVVEDELLVALDLAHTLEERGYHIVDIVDSGDKALTAADESRPDLVLIDITIRGDLDGIETASLLKARLGLPIVYVTSYVEGPIRERAMMTGPAGYVTKPFCPRELERAVAGALPH